MLRRRLARHPPAELAAQAAEAAGAQGRFWDMYGLLLACQDHLRKPDLLGYAAQLGRTSSAL